MKKASLIAFFAVILCLVALSAQAEVIMTDSEGNVLEGPWKWLTGEEITPDDFADTPELDDESVPQYILLGTLALSVAGGIFAHKMRRRAE